MALLLKVVPVLEVNEEFASAAGTLPQLTGWQVPVAAAHVPAAEQVRVYVVPPPTTPGVVSPGVVQA